MSCAVLVNQSGWPFFAALPLAFVSSAAIGVVLERSLYRHLYTRSHLDQVLFSVGLVFMSVAAGRLHHGVVADLHQASSGAGRAEPISFGVGIGRYRLMIIVICGLLTAGPAIGAGANTFLAAGCRAAVDDPRAASGLGIKRAAGVSPSPLLLGVALPVWGGGASAREILGT